MKRNNIIIIAVIALFVLFTAFYTGLLGTHFFVRKTSFKKLPGWEQNDFHVSLITFQKSCKNMTKGTRWDEVCDAALQLNNTDTENAKHFFEHWFKPYKVENNFNSKGLFTGYYLPLLHASLIPDNRYQIPIYGMPNGFSSFRGLPKRAEINKGALRNYAQVIAWCDNWLDIFFAQIQGSAMVELPDHTRFLIGYAGNNGHPYTAIGKILVANNALQPQHVSMQTIRAWLENHPQQMHAILDLNASYVFFRIVDQDSALGAQNVPLTPQYSLAVDTRYIPLGTPIFLATTVPSPSGEIRPFQKLVVAQDTGSAIKGVVRGDIYWGAGDDAAFVAGQMKSKGRYWILLPK